ncbi:uncharacterized protein LOC120086670 [Benincasa hispida]|uniref:uncharacterized protein LOC120086670 n=1 Tax=Benincasa hispida TaxID=102211 RepID=UPI0019017305|nr:uncharacterized protein LOC120086670 [Benincasa hispida]
MDIPPPHRSEPTSDNRYLRRTTPFQSLNFNAFAILFLIISLCFIFVILISPFYSFSFHFFKPQSPWKSMDFVSLALVLFAIACGLLSKNNGENTQEEIYSAIVTSNDSEQTHKSNPSTPNQWNGYSDRTDQILLHHLPEVPGVEYWNLFSGSSYMTNYQSLSSDSLQHCRNLKDFDDGFVSKRASRATFSVYDEEISSSFSALHQFSVPPLMTAPPQPSSPPVIIPPPGAVVEAEVERNNEEDENFEPELLGLNFQALEGEMNENEKQREVESKETKRNNKKKKMKKWKKGVENFKEFLTPQHRYNRPLPPPPAPPPSVAVHHYQTSSIIGEINRDFPAPPESPPQKLIGVRTQNSTGEQPPSTAAELQIVMKGDSTRNENAERTITEIRGIPDVNSKADSFIERFREGLKLERMNSIKERQRKTKTSILGRMGPE